MSATITERQLPAWRHPFGLSRIFSNEKASVILFVNVAMCLSGWVSFSLVDRATPGRDGGMDIIALAKLGVRLFMMMTFGILVVRLHSHTRINRWNIRSTSQLLSLQELSRRSRNVLSILLPWIMFAGWGFFSVFWSPLKSISFGQSLGLLTMLGLTWIIAVYCDHPVRRAAVVRWIGYMLLGFSVFVVGCYLIAPNASGMTRIYSDSGSVGIVHPTVAGANASLGIVLATWTCLHTHPSGRTSLRRNLLLAAIIAIHGLALFLSQSRTPLALAIMTVGIALVWRLSLRTAGLWLVMIACLCLAYVIVDPGFSLLENVAVASGDFLARGQTTAQLKQVSGRAEMWSAVWAEFLKSIWIGHGYFVTSAKGELDVWHGPFNYTAHNVYLQVLVSTGLIGTSICFVGAIRVIRHIDWFGRNSVKRFEGDAANVAVEFDDSFIRTLAVLLIIWFSIWTLTCESFLGPVRTESVIFFAMVGLLLSMSQPARKSHQASLLHARKIEA